MTPVSGIGHVACARLKSGATGALIPASAGITAAGFRCVWITDITHQTISQCRLPSLLLLLFFVSGEKINRRLCFSALSYYRNIVLIDILSRLFDPRFDRPCFVSEVQGIVCRDLDFWWFAVENRRTVFLFCRVAIVGSSAVGIITGIRIVGISRVSVAGSVCGVWIWTWIRIRLWRFYWRIGIIIIDYAVPIIFIIFLLFDYNILIGNTLIFFCYKISPNIVFYSHNK